MSIVGNDNDIFRLNTPLQIKTISSPNGTAVIIDVSGNNVVPEIPISQLRRNRVDPIHITIGFYPNKPITNNNLRNIKRLLEYPENQIIQFKLKKLEVGKKSREIVDGELFQLIKEYRKVLYEKQADIGLGEPDSRREFQPHIEVRTINDVKRESEHSVNIKLWKKLPPYNFKFFTKKPLNANLKTCFSTTIGYMLGLENSTTLRDQIINSIPDAVKTKADNHLEIPRRAYQILQPRRYREINTKNDAERESILVPNSTIEERDQIKLYYSVRHSSKCLVSEQLVEYVTKKYDICMAIFMNGKWKYFGNNKGKQLMYIALIEPSNSIQLQLLTVTEEGKKKLNAASKTFVNVGRNIMQRGRNIIEGREIERKIEQRKKRLKAMQNELKINPELLEINIASRNSKTTEQLIGTLKRFKKLRNVVDEVDTVLLNKAKNENENAFKVLIENLTEKKEKRIKELENIIHPNVRLKIRDFINNSKSPYCIVMVPLIFETNSSDNYDRILLIDCDVETQIKRSSLRDNQSNKDIQRIISSQATRDERLSIADDVVLNTSSFEYLRNEIFKIHKKYMEIINNA